jgi:hypothetical protein
MNHSAASFVRLKITNICPHVPINGKLKVIATKQLLMQPRNLFQCKRFEQMGDYAMNNGKYGPDNKQLFSQKNMMKCGSCKL